MAIYHCSVKTFSRSKGDSSVSAAAYRNGLSLTDQRTGLVADYTKRHGVVCSEIISPQENKFSGNSEELWNAVEQAENRKNSTVAREFEISLPHELDSAQRLDLARNITQNLADRFGLVAEFSIHKPDDENSKNHHVHILASTRKFEARKFTEKTRELDKNFLTKEEIAHGQKLAICEVREMVGTTINQHLKNAGINATVDHRSLLDQQQEALSKKDYSKALQLSREPTRHIGKNPEFIEENKAFNQKVKQDFSSLLKETNNQIKIKTKPKTASAKPLVTTGEKLELFIEEMGQKTKQVLQVAVEKTKAGASWIINHDHFGIEKRQLELQKQKQLEERKAQRELERKIQRENEWKQKASAYNKANEHRLEQEKENTFKKAPRPEPTRELSNGIEIPSLGKPSFPTPSPGRKFKP